MLRIDCATQRLAEMSAPRSEKVSESEVVTRHMWSGSPGRGPSPKTRRRATATPANLPEAVRENEEVVPVNAVSTWVLPSGVTAGR